MTKQEAATAAEAILGTRTPIALIESDDILLDADGEQVCGTHRVCLFNALTVVVVGSGMSWADAITDTKVRHRRIH